MPIIEKTLFKGDQGDDAEAKNLKLAMWLQNAWNDLDIVRIERIEIGSSRGWRVLYRE
jgi:hypothetical protein